MQKVFNVYYAHVKSYLEYASVVWFPSYDNRIDLWFLKICDKGCKLPPPPYVIRCKSIGIETLQHRRINLCALFVFDMVRGRINAAILLSKFNVPTRPLRNTNYPLLDRHRTNYELFEPVTNMSRIFNKCSHLYSDSITRQVFRSAVCSLILT